MDLTAGRLHSQRAYPSRQSSRRTFDQGFEPDVNGHFWVFAAATTNVEYTLRVTDTRTGAERRYPNPLGRAAPALTDTSALATCP